MSRRDGVLKGLSAALQPKNLDLTKFARDRVGDTGGRVVTRNMTSEDAAGALGFAAMDWLEDPRDEHTKPEDAKPGDPLVAALIRIKYAEHRRLAFFARALQLLLDRRSETDERRPSDTMRAVATGALFEWLHDACPRCRGRRSGVPKVRACVECGQRWIQTKVTQEDGTKKIVEVLVGAPRLNIHGRDDALLARATKLAANGHPVPAMEPPLPPCPKCKDLGRIFQKAREGKGVRCIPCEGTGRRTFTARERWRLVSLDLVKLQKKSMAAWKREIDQRGYSFGRRPKIDGIKLRVFTESWVKFYEDFIAILRKADRRAHVSIDTQISRMENADTVPGRDEKEKAPSDESYFPVGQAPQAELPPQET